MPSFSKPDDLHDPIAELVRVNPVPSLIVDMESLTVVVVNQATNALLGYSEQELLGKSLLELVPAEDVAKVQQAADEPAPERRNLMARFPKRSHLALREAEIQGDVLSQQGCPLHCGPGSQRRTFPATLSFPALKRDLTTDGTD